MNRNNAAHRFARPAFLALSCVGAFATYPVFAAGDPDPDPVPANDDDDEQDRRDIVITDQKLKERAGPKDVAPIVNTPKSIIILDKSVIEQTGSNSLQDALRTVPGITFAAAEGGNPIGDRPFIRGFDAQGSIFVDGVRDLASQNREVFAIDSVQIIRGSDSTLGGRGSAGGTINIISRLPTEGTFGSVSGSYGNGDYKRVSGDVNVQVAPTIAFRIQGVWHDQGVVDRDAIYNKRWGFAPSVTIGLGTSTRLTASYYYLESHELPDSGIPYLYVCNATNCNTPAGTTFTTPALGSITTLGGQTGTVSRSAFYGLVGRDFRNTKSQQATLRFEHDFGGVTLRNTARYSNDEQAYIYTQPDDTQGNVFGTSTTNSAVVRPDGGLPLTSGGYVWRRANTRYGYVESIVDQLDLYGVAKTGSIEHSFAVGAEFSWEKARRGTFVNASGSGITPRCDTFTVSRGYCTSLFNPNPYQPFVNYTSDTSTVATAIVRGDTNTETQNDANTISFYGFDSITLTPSLILNLGARFDRFKSTTVPAFTAGGPSFRFSRTDELFNWQAGLVFKPTKDTSLYASYSTAATPPNSLLGEGREDNALPTTVATANQLDFLKVQKTRSYELGAKASLFKEKLSLATAIFQTGIDNARVTDANNLISFLGKTRIRGFEFSASGVILKGWTVFGGYTYLDAKIVDGGFTALTVPAVTGQVAKTVLVPSVNTGKQVPQVAKNSFTFTTNYQVTKQFSIGGSTIYTDRQYGGYADNRTATQTNAGVVMVAPATKLLSRGIDGYWQFDAQARFALTRNIAMSVNAQNLTNKIYFSQAFTNHYATIAPGRTVFGTLEFKF
ncbi:MAG: TonB-dependent receptor [Sphingomonas bacterium]|nr:TonB-dependent receptor [Sphingomonas bacterium]